MEHSHLNNSSSSDYILFVGQESGFQSRSMLIPYKEFLKVRKEDYEILKNIAKNRVFTSKKDKNQQYSVDNVIIIECVPIYNLSTFSKKQQDRYETICDDLLHYADYGNEYGVSKLGDELWINNAITNLCKGHDHVKNYLRCLKLKQYKGHPINIVDNFLVLQTSYSETQS